MIELYINDQSCELSPDVSISYEIRNNILDLDSIQGTRTYPFQLPATQRNRKLFGNPEEIPLSGSPFVNYPARLVVQGAMLAAGLFRLTKANQAGYEGFLTAGAGTLTDKKSTSIRDILAGVVHVFDSEDFKTSHLFGINSNQYVRGNEVVTFPEIQNGNKIHNGYSFGYLPPNTKLDPGYLPMFKLTYVLKRLMAQLGFRIQNDWTAADPMLEKVVLFNTNTLPLNFSLDGGGGFTSVNVYDPINGVTVTLDYNNAVTTYPAEIRVSDHVPDMTLTEFLNGLTKTFGLKYFFDARFGTVQLRFIRDLLKDKKSYQDWTPFIERRGFQAEELEYKGLRFAFSKDSNDKRLSDQPESLDGQNLQTARDTFADLPDSDSIGTIRLVTEENKYYVRTLDQRDYSQRWEPYCFAQVDYVEDDGLETIQSPFSPLQHDKQHLYTGENGVIADNGSGKIRLLHNNVVQEANSDIRLDDARLNPTGEWYAVTADNDQYADTGQDYEAAEENVRWTRRVASIRKRPVVDVPTSHLDEGEEIAGFAPRLLFFHGLQPQEGGVGNSYPLGAADQFSNDNLPLGNLALRWNGNDGLVAAFWREYITLRKDGRKAENRLMLPIENLIGFDPALPVRIRDTNFWMANLRCNLSLKGISPQRVELVRLGQNYAPFPTYDVSINYQICNTEPEAGIPESVSVDMAYGLYLINPAYIDGLNQPLVRLNIKGYEADFYPNSTGQLRWVDADPSPGNGLVNSIEFWFNQYDTENPGGDSNIYVVRLYDQSGNGNDLVPTDPANMAILDRANKEIIANAPYEASYPAVQTINTAMGNISAIMELDLSSTTNLADEEQFLLIDLNPNDAEPDRDIPLQVLSKFPNSPDQLVFGTRNSSNEASNDYKAMHNAGTNPVRKIYGIARGSFLFNVFVDLVQEKVNEPMPLGFQNYPYDQANAKLYALGYGDGGKNSRWKSIFISNQLLTTQEYIAVRKYIEENTPS